MNKKGFTMVEILIAIAILAVISMVVIPSIVRYITEGKDTYNEKLENQLLVAGKNYFADNESLLPKKTYLDRNTEKHSYATVPEMQSKNYLDQEFVDSNGNPCTESFVFVTIPAGETEEDWYACLKCEGENGEGYQTENDYCDISNWDDNTAPVCGITDGDRKGVTISGGTTVNNNKHYNPKTVTIANYKDEDDLSQIWIINKTTNYKKVLDVYNQEENEIKGINLVNYFEKDKNGKLIDGEYEIYLRDTGGNFSSICNDRILIDNTAPSCNISSVQNETEKKVKLTTKDNLSDEIYSVINKVKNTEKENIKNKKIRELSLIGQTDGTYYGHVLDEAGNYRNCSTNVKIEMYEDEEPYCVFTKNADSSKYLKAGAEEDLQVECYAYQADKATYDKEKITKTNTNNIGSLTSVENTKDNKNKDNKKIFDLTYKATTERKSGTDYVNIEEAYITDVNKKTNKKIRSNAIKVDAIPPVVKQTPNKSKTSGGWYQAPLTVTATCTDSGGSGISKLTFAGKSGTSSVSVTRTTAANPVKYTAACTDKAGNSVSSGTNYYVRVYSAHSSCGIQSYKSCRTSACGCQTTKYCTNGCKTYRKCTGYTSWKCSTRTKSSKCGVLGSSNRPTCPSCKASSGTLKKVTCGDCRLSVCTYGVAGGQATHKIKRTVKTCTRSKTTYNCGCKTYYYRTCGCKLYKSCRNKACGVQSYKTCWHY